MSYRLWIHDYEPTELSHIIGNSVVIETLQSFLRSHDLPNLLLCGPHGCGKTTIAKLMVKTFLGTDNPQFHLEIDGSIYRGKSVVSEKVDKKKSGDIMVNGPNIVHYIRKTLNLPEHTCRIITIYDFECMTSEAQMALRRVIEIYSQRVRFIFICNNLSKIIEAIQSRTLILKCQPIALDDVVHHLKWIAQERHLVIPDEVFQTIGMISQGDLKQAINYLQVYSRSPEYTIESFYHLFNLPSIQTIRCLIDWCLKENGVKAFNILDQLIESGYNVTDLLDVLIKVLVYHQTLKDNQRVLLLEEVIKTICLNEHSSSVVHLYQLIVKMIWRTQYMKTMSI